MPGQLREHFFNHLLDISVRKHLLNSSLILCLLAAAGCRRVDRMNAYPEFTDLFPADMVRFPPVILVGRILVCVPVGSPRPSIWDGDTPYQEYRTTVAVENVLNGTIQSPKTDVYFLKNLRNGGLKDLGQYKAADIGTLAIGRCSSCSATQDGYALSATPSPIAWCQFSAARIRPFGANPMWENPSRIYYSPEAKEHPMHR